MERVSIESDRSEGSSSTSIVLKTEEGGVRLECAHASKINASGCATITAASNHCHFWSQFPGFIPDPTAPLQEDFARLASHMRWGAAARRKHLADAIRAEISFHYSGTDRLAYWQSVCKEVGVGKNLKSIADCKKVRVRPRSRTRMLSMAKQAEQSLLSVSKKKADMFQALRLSFVNLFNLIDHSRNPEIRILRFSSFDEFSRFTQAGNKLPRQLAKEGNLTKMLLKKF
jgi:hypothetical protein